MSTIPSQLRLYTHAKSGFLLEAASRRKHRFWTFYYRNSGSYDFYSIVSVSTSKEISLCSGLSVRKQNAVWLQARLSHWTQWLNIGNNDSTFSSFLVALKTLRKLSLSGFRLRLAYLLQPSDTTVPICELSYYLTIFIDVSVPMQQAETIFTLSSHRKHSSSSAASSHSSKLVSVSRLAIFTSEGRATMSWSSFLLCTQSHASPRHLTQKLSGLLWAEGTRSVGKCLLKLLWIFILGKIIIIGPVIQFLQSESQQQYQLKSEVKGLENNRLLVVAFLLADQYVQELLQLLPLVGSQ